MHTSSHTHVHMHTPTLGLPSVRKPAASPRGSAQTSLLGSSLHTADLRRLQGAGQSPRAMEHSAEGPGGGKGGLMETCLTAPVKGEARKWLTSDLDVWSKARITQNGKSKFQNKT